MSRSLFGVLVLCVQKNTDNSPEPKSAIPLVYNNNAA